VASLTLILALLASPPTHALRTQQEQSSPADHLVRQLGPLPAALPALARSDGSIDPIEERRRELYARILALGQAALPALKRGLASPDVQVRRNVVLFLNVAANPVSMVQPCLPELITALHDSDARVRGLAAQAIGQIGPMAVSAVPGLMLLLADPHEGSRNSACIGLAGIGPAAGDALPALSRALSDASPDVRRFVQRAIDKIDVR
jgi:HEAT repeat protein